MHTQAGTWSTASAWDPWSGTPAFDPWKLGSEGYGGVAPTMEVLASAPSMPQPSLPAKAKKRKQKDPQQGMWVKNKQGDKEVWFDTSLMRGGIYGFRADSSSDDEEDTPNDAHAASATHLATQTGSCSPRAVIRGDTGSSVLPVSEVSDKSSCLVVQLPNKVVAVKNNKRHRNAVEPTQRMCTAHKRVRFSTALMEDGNGQYVCKPGSECG